jgi:undecaprenyl-diphosphatase
MPFLRNSLVWVPFYIFLALFGILNFRKTGFWWILFAACTVISSDLVSSGLIKNNIYRLRPCNDPGLSSWLHVLVAYRPQSSSFTSSHAANHFSLALFLFQTCKNFMGKWAWIFMAWAFSISYAQIYVGVHYPIDIAGGTLIGLIIGYLSSHFFNRLYDLQSHV